MPQLSAGPPLDQAAFAEVRRRTIFEACKWDPQVGDVPVLAPFPLLLEPGTWRQLAGWAERLAKETLAAEREVAHRPELHPRLGLCRALRRALGRVAREGLPAEVARVMRFDFHLTPTGFCISEVNSDVPGGYIEASGFTALMQRACGADGAWAEDPASALVEALCARVPRGGVVGLVHATAYTDDRQVMVYLQRRLEARGLRGCLISPADLTWSGGRATIGTRWFTGPADALCRFFPGEWLVDLPSRCGWTNLFAGARTPLSNPATSLLSQSKRLPLLWDSLRTPMPTWRALLPQTVDPREVDWRRDDGWVLKAAFGRVGAEVGVRGVTSPSHWEALARAARWFPSRWVAQRRFVPSPLETALGPRYPCLGVYVIDGRAAGIYGRIGRTGVVDHEAEDVAVLIAHDPAQDGMRGHGQRIAV